MMHVFKYTFKILVIVLILIVFCHFYIFNKVDENGFIFYVRIL